MGVGPHAQLSKEHTMRRLIIAGAVIAFGTLAGTACGGKSETETVVEQKAEEAAKGAEQAAEGLQSMAKSLEAMAGAAMGGDTKPVDPVSFRELQTAFGNLDGWEKGKPTGERMTMPVNFSQAEVIYTKGDSRIEMKIIDSGLNQILMAPYAMFLTAGYEKETADGYEKSTQVAGYPGWERWDESSKDGSLNAVVNKRFLVTIEGDGIDDAKILHQAAASTDLKKLEAMK
jgi:hypothetical protein